MKQPEFIADIHMHPTLKSSNWTKKDGEKNPWEEFHHIKPTTPASRWGSMASKTLAKYSQCNFYKLMDGNVRMAFISLYPFERGFFDMRNAPKVLASKKALIEMFAIGSGVGYEQAEKLFKDFDYYKEFKKEYKYLKTHEGESPNGKYTYKIVNNYTELKESLAKKNELAVIITAEGCHALLDREMYDGKLDKKHFKERIKKHVSEVKQWENPPFFMNLMHHFDNHLGGHAKSLKDAVGLLLNQKKGLELDLNDLGLKTLKELLSNSNGKRILIDIKHMSLKGRKEYYTLLRNYNYLNKHDNIPVICSHTGVNGYKTMKGSHIKPDTGGKNAKSHFFNWAINMSDEELNIIHQTQGLMGIIIDKGKLGGGGFLKQAKKETDQAKLKEMYMKQIWDNIFQIPRAIGSKSAWDILALGTDFDGAINHVDFYDDATKLPTLFDDLYEYLDRTKYEKKLWYSYKPEELLYKIFGQNTLDFMERNFV